MSRRLPMLFSILLVLILVACRAGPTATPTPTRMSARPTSTPTATTRPKPTATPTHTPTITPTPLPDAIVNNDILNLRTGPGTVYDIIKVMQLGDELDVTARNEAGTWLAVTTSDGSKGWCSTKYLQLNVSLDDIPIATDIPPTPTPSEPTPTPTPEGPTPTPTITPTPVPAVDAEIDKIAAGEHGGLGPPGEVGHVGAGGEAEVTIINDTPYELTLLVGAPNSVSITIEACPVCEVYSLVGPIFCPEEGRPQRVVRLKPGTCEVAAKVSDPSVTPFYGTWELKGDTSYFNCFYIVTSFQ